MSIKRVAVIFDNTSRPETTGIYCRRALGDFVEVEHFLPSELEQLQPGDFDLYLNIDDGLRYQLPDQLQPAAWWVIDTHLDLAGSLEKAPRFDFVFAAQQDGAKALREAGIETAVWLPLACDPEIHGRKPVNPTYDVTFVGNLFPGARAELVELLQQRFESVFVGNRYLEKMAETYSASKIVFNRSLKNDVIINDFFLRCLIRSVLRVQVKVDATVVLRLPLRERARVRGRRGLLGRGCICRGGDRRQLTLRHRR